MRSFKGQPNYIPSTTQPQIYTPSRQQYQNKIFNTTQTSSNKNKNRAQQIVSLHEQFQDLKKKIKQVQNKNQRIIQKIHRECNFKKKNPQTFDLLIDNTAPIIYYEKKQKSQVSQISGMSIDQSNKSDQSEYQFKQKKNNVVQQRNSVQSNKNISPTMFSQSMQYTKESRERDRDRDRNRNRDFQRDPPRMDKIQKKYSKISANNNNVSNNRYNDDHNAQSINSQEMLVENQFQEETPNLKFQMQGSHQTYSHLKQISANNNSAAYNNNNSGKKSMIIPSYPSSQTQMTYNGVGLTPSHSNNNKILSSSSQQFSQQHIMHHHPPLMTSAFTPQQKNPSNNNSLHQSMFNLPLYQIQQSLKIQKQKTAYLQEQLKQKQFQILQIKKQYNKVVSQFDNWEMILQDHLDNFMENVIKKGFFDIQKVMKKNQNRVRNLSMRIKDQYEEHKSNKLIKEHQLRRSNSRSKRDLSPVHNTSINSAISPLLPPNHQSKIPKPNNPTSPNILQIQTIANQRQKQKDRQQRQSKSKLSSDQSFKKNKQFQQIVSKYEQMINIKNSQISKLQTVIKSLNRKNDDLQLVVQKKDKQLKEITIKMEELQKLMSEMDNQVPVPIVKKRNYNSNNSRTISGVEDKMRRISSNQSNLLEDIYQQDVVKEYKETEFQLKYLEVKQELEESNEKISELENKILTLQHKVKSAQSIKIDQSQRSNPGSNSNIPSPHHQSQYQQQKIIKQKVEQARRDLLYSHQQQLQIREQQIQKLKQKITRIQKTLVQKDCEIISFENKIKKLQGVNQINYKKIQEYEKLLNHYQHNNSVDLENNQIGMMLLDKSLCYDNAENNLTTRSTNGGGESTVGVQKHKGAERSASKKNIVIARTELQNLQNQIESMNQQILTLTKKIKNLQSSQRQKVYQLQRITDEFQTIYHQKHTLSKQNNSLKDKITELQQKLQQIENNSYQQNQQSYQIQESQNNNQIDLLEPRQNLVLEKNNNSIYSQKSQTTSRIKNKSVNQGRQKQRKKSQLHEVVLIQQQKRDILQRQLIQQKQNNQSKRRLQQQIQTLKSKNFQLSKQLNSLKSQHLQISRNNISLKKDNQYLQDSLSDREQKYQKYRKEYEEVKVKLNQMIDLCHKKDQELKKEKQQNCAKIQELEKQWYEFQEQINRNNNNNQHNQNLMQSSFTDHLGNRNHGNESQLLKSSRYNISQSSLLLTSTLHNKNSQYLQEQNQYLTIKLKQAQATIEMHNMMQQKVLNEYKTNVQKLKLEIKQKTKQCDGLKKEHEIIKDSKRRLEILLESSKNQLEQYRQQKEKLEKEKELLSVRQRQMSQYSNKKSERSKRNVNVNIINNEKQNNEIKVEQNNQNQNDNYNEKSLDMQQFAQFNEQENNLSMMSQQQLQQMSQIQHLKSNQKPSNLNLKQSQKSQKSQFQQQQRLHPYQRIIELQNDLKQQKDINKKLQQMQEQLFKQIRIKQQEKNDLMKLIDQKNMKIQQLQQIVELKQMNVNTSHIGSNILGSHISSSNHKSSSNHHNGNNFKQSQNNLSQRESMHSHSSLRYSGITHNNRQPIIMGVINPSSNTLNVMGQSQLGHSQRFEIQLSETGSQMLDQSYVTNISQIFQRQEFPYEKVQLKRKQQIKLFQKTASYIKSLKDSINQKNKKIKLLQKKIQSLKNNHHGTIAKELQNKYQISTGINEKQETNIQLDYEFQSVYKDYESVQLQRKRASHNKRYKTLQHQWKLALQQNNVLSNQIQALQQQLQKAQQQQNNLLKIKDLYKDQIKKLITKNDSQVQYYQDLLAKQKKKVQQSQAVHNMQTLKQLFLKTIDCIIVIQSQKTKKKRQQKRKELEEYFNIFASISSIDQKRRYIIVEGIRKMTLNIVLAEQGRGSSSSKKKE